MAENIQSINKVGETWSENYGTINIYKVVWGNPSGQAQKSYIVAPIFM